MRKKAVEYIFLKKEKMLVTSISFFINIFYFPNLPKHFYFPNLPKQSYFFESHFFLSSANAFSFDKS